MSEAPNQTPPPYEAQDLRERDARMWAMICHLSGFAFYLMPLANIVAPLAIWLVKRDEHPLIDDQGKEATNFQISMTLYGTVLGILTFILMFVLIGFALIPVLFVLGLMHIILMIVAAVRANGGEAYRYPLTIRFIR